MFKRVACLHTKENDASFLEAPFHVIIPLTFTDLKFLSTQIL